MLLQIHWQFKDGHTDMRAQKDIDPENQRELSLWVEEVKRGHPLPAEAMWMICNEKSEYFSLTLK